MPTVWNDVYNIRLEVQTKFGHAGKLFSLINLHGKYISWVIRPTGWFRINKYILRWKLMVKVNKVRK